MSFLQSFPFDSLELIKALDEAYPHRCPSTSTPDRDIWLYAGKRQLIDDLMNRVERLKDDEADLTTTGIQLGDS